MEGHRFEELRALLPNCMRQDRQRLEARLREILDPHRSPQTHRLDTQLERCLREARQSVSLRHRRHEGLPQVSYPPELPITARKDDIVAAIRNHQVVVIAGETGSGKTTQLPKMCLEAGYGLEGKIACTQPRRVAARSISRRLAEELNMQWGRGVGCKIRFSDESDPQTYIKVMTDGMLLAETQGDRDLDEYEAIIIDEAHERSLNIDFLLGHLKLLLQRRPELKLIISSATIDTEAFSQAFNNAPVIEVSGRMYPVEIRYAPFDLVAEEEGDITYIDAAVNAVETIYQESARGDILIFMPGERDIRETADDLEGRYGGQTDIIPLFGRLSAGEQERVFAPSPRRKIIVSTNIAETSLTIPGIRYVVDAGLARISRYSPRTRTRRLPIEPIAQASANQRAGRCGRVANGICIRLYSEEDYNERPRFTQPEIQRANLAEVILRMKAWHLGDIETFPFLNPPQPQAIQRGYELLQELGALDEQRNLTPLGKDLSRLPVDPSIGRMVLQSVREQALEPVLVIAAGLSIQDPRERPLDRPEAADQAHRQFMDPDSDFLSLLNIWNAFHDRWEACKTQNQVRKFCHANFLSYLRMREWVDIHTQLRESLREVMHFSTRDEPNVPPAGPVKGEDVDWLRKRPGQGVNYVGVHRSILTGLLGQVARRQERNIYRAPGDRQAMVFPASSLFDRNEAKTKTPAKPVRTEPGATKKPSQPEWVMSGEIVETSRLFARTLARINPEWILELGAHLVKRSHTDPHWNRKHGRVLVRERITLLGLEIKDHFIDYGKINPQDATDMLIRCALIEEDMEVVPPFVEHNRQIRQKLEVMRTRMRGNRLPDLDESLYAFYAQRIQQVSSIHDLNRVLHQHHKQNDKFLHATEKDLAGGVDIEWEAAGFPSQVKVANHAVKLEYAYAPGEDHDGITVKMPAAMVPLVKPGMLDWIVPGLREEQVEFLLKALPRSLRVPLMPLPPKAKELAADLQGNDDLEALRLLVSERYGVTIPAEVWRREDLPAHLRVRVAVTGKEQKVVATGRDLEQLKHGLEQHDTPAEQNAWAQAAQQWERYELTGWSFGNLPERIEVTSVAGVPLYAYPGLQQEQGAVHLKLFRRLEEAQAVTRGGFARLIELGIQRELGWLEKDLRPLDKVKDLYITLGPGDELTATALGNLKRHLIQPPPVLLPLRQETYESTVDAAKARIPGLAGQLINRVGAILRARQEILVTRKTYHGMRQDLDALLPRRFLDFIPFERLEHVPRYLKAMQVRAERAALSPAKDQEKARQLQPLVQVLWPFVQKPPASDSARRALHEYRWMLEEFKVSLFAQELGTAMPISAKRLNAQLAEINGK